MRIKNHKVYSILFPWVIVSFFFLSCEENQTTHRLLRETEAVMDSIPHDAYAFLIEADSIGCFSRAQRAEWNLLITQAMDKVKEKPASDSIIRQAVDYYAQKEDPHRQMLSYYYWGRVTHTLGDALRAQDYYLEAREKAIQIHNAPYLARINSNIGMLYLYQELPEEALPYLLETERYFFSINDSLNLRLATRNLGRVYDMLNKPDSALSYYKKALTYATLPGQQVLLLNEIIPLYINQAEYDSVFVCVQEVQKLSEYRLSLQSSLVVGQYFAHTNQPDSANYYLKKCLDTDKIHIHATACFHLYQMAREKQDLKNYTLYHTKYEILRDSIMDNTYTEKLLHLQTLYDYEKKENEIMQVKLAYAEERQRKYLFVLIATILLLFLGYTIYRLRLHIKEWNRQIVYWRQRQEAMEYNYIEQIQLNDQEIEKLNSELKNQNRQTEKLQTKIEDLKQKNKELKQKSNGYKTALKTLFESDVYKLFHDPNNQEITEEYKKEFVQLMDEAYPIIKVYLMEKCPNLSEEELLFCYLSKAKISPSATAIITGGGKSTVTNKRSLLAWKIFKKSKSAPIFDKEISKIN